MANLINKIKIMKITLTKNKKIYAFQLQQAYPSA